MSIRTTGYRNRSRNIFMYFCFPNFQNTFGKHRISYSNQVSVQQGQLGDMFSLWFLIIHWSNVQLWKISMSGLRQQYAIAVYITIYLTVKCSSVLEFVLKMIENPVGLFLSLQHVLQFVLDILGCSFGLSSPRL